MKTERVLSSDKISWAQQGPGNSGMCDIVRYHPSFPDTVFFGPDMGGNYQSDDNGTHWYSVRDPDGDNAFTRLAYIQYSTHTPDLALATDGAQLYQSDNRGKAWSVVKNCPWYVGPNTDGTDREGWIDKISAFEIDPNNADTWYVGAGRTPRGKFWESNLRNGLATAINPRGQAANLSGKIWKTNDGGQNWTELTSGIDPAAQFSRIIVNPNNSQQVFAASNYGLYRSSNGGQSWVNIGTGKLPNNTVVDLDFYNKDGNFILYLIDQVRYAEDGNTTSNTGGVFRSSDEGNTWADITGNLYLDLNQLTGAVDTTYYWYIAKWFGLSEADAKSRFPIKPTTALQPLQLLRVDPSQADSLYVGFNDPQGERESFAPGRLWGTSNGGQQWLSVARGFGPAWKNDESYWASRGQPVNENMSFGHEAFDQQWGQNYPWRSLRYFDVNAHGELMMISAHNTLLSKDRGVSWQQVDEDYTAAGNVMGRGNSDLPGEALLQDHRLAPGELYLASGEHRLWRTTDDGEGSGKDERVAMKLLRTMDTVTALALAPDDVNTIFVTSQRQHALDEIWKSTDAGENFSSLGKATEGTNFMRTESLKIDPTNKNYMYFGVSERGNEDLDRQGGFYFSGNGGRSFVQRNNGLPENAYIKDIEWDPRDPSYQSLFIAAQAASFALTNKFPPKTPGGPAIEGGLYHSSDRGQNWTKIDINEEVHGINAVEIDQLGRIYATAGYRRWDFKEGGLWHSDNWGATWTKTFESDITENLDVSLFNPNLLIVSVGPAHKNSGIYLSEDRGQTWTKNNYTLALKERISAVEFSIHDPDTLWLSEVGGGFSKGTLSNNTSCRYDFGTPHSPEQAGWQSINATTNLETLSWTGTPSNTDHGETHGSNNITRDLVGGSEAAMLEHTLQNGRWFITLKLGDLQQSLDNIQIKAEGETVSSNIQVQQGRVGVVNFPVDILDGKLSLEFSDSDTSGKHWSLLSMVLTKVGQSADAFAPGLCIDTAAPSLATPSPSPSSSPTPNPADSPSPSPTPSPTPQATPTASPSPQPKSESGSGGGGNSSPIIFLILVAIWARKFGLRRR